MKYFEIKNKEEMNNFAASQNQAQFLQSWEWGEFQEAAGNKVIRLGFKDEKERLFFAVSLIKKNLPAGKSYLYAARINFKNLKEEQVKFIFDSIKEIAKKEKAIFLRFEPLIELKIENWKLKIKRSLDVQPSKTLILDLSKPEEELLKQMHSKTRYNIRLAEKKGVKIREAGEGDFEKFWAIMEETKERDGFRLHGKEYYRKMIFNNQDTRYNNQTKSKIQMSNDKQIPNTKSQITNYKLQITNSNMFIKLLLAEYENKIIAGNIVSFFCDMTTYVHGASSNEYRNLMAPYLLQWEAIKMAKGLGYTHYDFNGADEKKWPGVTRFKKGFGGAEVSYPGTFDMVFSEMWYNLYKIVRRLRRG